MILTIGSRWLGQRQAKRSEDLASALTLNEYKVIIIGDVGVGKTSLLRRFVHNTFEDRVSHFLAEEKKLVMVDGQEIILNIWDTAGKHGQCGMTNNYVQIRSQCKCTGFHKLLRKMHMYDRFHSIELNLHFVSLNSLAEW